MMREILFRGKPVGANGEIIKKRHFVHGCHRKQSNGHIIYEETDGMYGTEVDPGTVGQFTGVYDAEGNKIFEGDILEGPKATRWEVVFCKASFMLIRLKGAGFIIGIPDGYQIIGNTADNPKLLEGKDEHQRQ